MENFNIVSLIISFLGGGTVSALINWMLINFSDKKDRKIKFLDEQIIKLYGPLYYLVIQSEKLFQLNNKFIEAFNKEYVIKNWSMEKYTKEILTNETTITLETANKYIRLVEKNNEKMKDIIDKSFYLLDPDDIDVVMVFFEHYTRLDIEKDTDGKITIPFQIYTHIGDISFLSPEIIEKIKKKFLNKKQKIEKLLKK